MPASSRGSRRHAHLRALARDEPFSPDLVAPALEDFLRHAVWIAAGLDTALGTTLFDLKKLRLPSVARRRSGSARGSSRSGTERLPAECFRRERDLKRRLAHCDHSPPLGRWPR